MKMGHSIELDNERQSLIGYVRFCAICYNGSVAENLDYVVDVLHEDITLFKRMLDHAKSLQGSNSTPDKQYDIEKLVAKLTEKELPIVKDYMFALGAYITGQPFKPVKEAASKLLSLIPIPDTITAPPGTFSKKLIDAYNLV